MKPIKVRYVLISVLVNIHLCLPMAEIAEQSIVRGAAEEAFGEAANSLEKGAVESMAKTVADSMGVSVEDIGKLPEETQAAFKKELAESFKAYASIKDGQFELNFPKTLDQRLKVAQQNFNATISEVAKSSGFSPLQREALAKFGVEADVLAQFPKRSPEPLPKGFSSSDVEFTSEQKTLIQNRDAVINAQADLTYATHIQDPSLIAKAQESLSKAEGSFEEVLTRNVESAEKATQEAQENLAKLESQASSPEELNAAEVKVEEAKQNEVLSKKARAKNTFDSAKKAEADAKIARDTAEKQLKDIKNNRTASEKDIGDAERTLEEAQKKYDESLQAFKKARQDWFKETGWFEASGEKLKVYSRDYAEQTVKRVGNTIKEQLPAQLANFVAAFVFTLPNYIIGPIQSKKQRDAQFLQISRPQSFGSIWMQIPRDLINQTAPLTSYPLYVGIGQPSTAEVKTRSDDADTESYLKNANYYVPVTEYDQYATTAITDPNFSNRMVHLNTGYYFIRDGLPFDQKNPTVPFINVDPKGRQESLQSHLDSMAGAIAQGIVGELYEYTTEESAYSGNKTIANLLDQQKNNDPAYILPVGERYGSILAPAIDTFAHATSFGPYKLKAFKALKPDDFKKLVSGLQVKPVKDYPYVAWSIPPRGYVYETKDTPDIKAIIKNLGANDPLSKIITDYVVLFMDTQSPLVPLLIPQNTGSVDGTPSYQLNPNASLIQLVSLVTGKSYTLSGEVSNASALVESLIGEIDDNMVGQITAMQSLYQQQWKIALQQLKYGPFTFGRSTLTVDSALADKGVFVYQVDQPKLENGSDDLVVAIGLDESKKPVVVQLPNDTLFAFASVITSRFYDIHMSPWMERIKEWYVYKTPMGTFVLATGSPKSDLGTTLFGYPDKMDKDAKPFFYYSMFMDPEINPNKPTTAQQKILQSSGAQTAQGKATAASQVLPIASQWVLSGQGLLVDTTNQVHLGDFIDKNAQSLRDKIDKQYTEWKSKMLKDPKQLTVSGPFRFTTDLLRNILLWASSVQDIKNGNFVYTSGSYPGEYLVLADDSDGKINLAKEYNFASPQRFAISLSTGNVYDSQSQGQLVKSGLDTDDLLERAQRVPFLSALAAEIKKTQVVHQETLSEQQFGSDTEFGRFKFYLTKDDLKNGFFVYGDATTIKDPLTLSASKLQEKITNYFVAIEGPINDSQQWVYGKKLSPQTTLVLSLVTGALYDRGGSFQQNLRLFDQELDTTQGFIEKIFALLEKTWGSGFDKSPRKGRIIQLTQQALDAVQKERQIIVQEREKEEQMYAPMNPNLRANLDSAEYIAELKDAVPPRFLKEFDGKYYFVSPNDTGLQRTYIDYNVGDPGKDNGVGVVYDAQGNAGLRLTGWTLESMRVQAGIAVGANGAQTFDRGINHSSIPMSSMIKLDSLEIEKIVDLARVSLRSAHEQIIKDPTNTKNREAFARAALKYHTLMLAQESARTIKRAGIPVKGPFKYDFYFNPEISTYFVKIGTGDEQHYIDLDAGFFYDLNGMPRIKQTRVFVNKNRTNNDCLFVGQDAAGLFTAVFKGSDGKYTTWSSLAGQSGAAPAMQMAKDGKSILYRLVNNDDGSECVIISVLNDDGSIKQYNISLVDSTSNALVPFGDFVPSNNLFFSQIVYSSTNGSYKKDDAPLNPVGILFNQSQQDKITSLLYKQNLIELTPSSGGFAGTYLDSLGAKVAVTIKIITKNYSPTVAARWISLKDQEQTYEYLFDVQQLDTQIPTSCINQATALEAMKLHYWKQCAWKLNGVIDSRGLARLVNNIPAAENLVPVDISMVTQLPDNQDARNIVQSSLGRMYYDAQNERYVTVLTADQDQGWDYFTTKYANWYVDVSNGILFDPTAATIGAFPRTSLLPSQLDTLLARLGIGVGYVQDQTGSLAYDDFGKPVVVNGKQIRTKKALVYRGTLAHETAKAHRKVKMRRARSG